MLVRPYLLNAAANRQKRQLEKEAEELGLEPSSEPNANALRGGKSSKAAEEEAKSADWGSKTKTRQRKAQEKKARAQQDAESDREIEQFLRG